jgi:hypothetical protein
MTLCRELRCVQARRSQCRGSITVLRLLRQSLAESKIQAVLPPDVCCFRPRSLACARRMRRGPSLPAGVGWAAALRARRGSPELKGWAAAWRALRSATRSVPRTAPVFSIGSIGAPTQGASFFLVLSVEPGARLRQAHLQWFLRLQASPLLAKKARAHHLSGELGVINLPQFIAILYPASLVPGSHAPTWHSFSAGRVDLLFRVIWTKAVLIYNGRGVREGDVAPEVTGS